MRNRTSSSPGIISSGMVLLTLGAMAPASAVEYGVTDLGAIELNGVTTPLSIDSAGRVVGFSTKAILTYPIPQPILWYNGVLTQLGTLSGAIGGLAQCINDSNQVVGGALDVVFPPVYDGKHNHAFRWQSGTMTDLGSFTSDANDLSSAYAINAGGHIVCNWAPKTDPNTQNAVLRWSNGTVTSLGTLGGAYSFARDINDANQVVGKSTASDGKYHAFVWQNGVMSDLGFLSGYDTASESFAINASGQVVGVSTSSAIAHSFLWNGTAMTDLGTLSGYPSTNAYAMNDSGMVVGTAFDPNGQPIAFIWKQGQIYDLNTLISPSSGWTLTAATGINKAGQVIGSGTYNGHSRAFIMKVYALTVNVVGGTYGSVTVDPNAAFYEPNAPVSLRMALKAKGGFFGWSGDVPSGHEYDNPLSLTMDSSKDVIATFKCGGSASALGPFLPLTGIALLMFSRVRRRI